jgi:hypothetical protein
MFQCEGTWQSVRGGRDRAANLENDGGADSRRTRAVAPGDRRGEDPRADVRDPGAQGPGRCDRSPCPADAIMAAIPAEPDMSTAHATIVALIEAAAAGSELMGIFDRQLFALTAQRAPWKRPCRVPQPDSDVSMRADLRRSSLRPSAARSSTGCVAPDQGHLG